MTSKEKTGNFVFPNLHRYAELGPDSTIMFIGVDLQGTCDVPRGLYGRLLSFPAETFGSISAGSQQPAR